MDLAEPLIDTFHEGEELGFLPAIEGLREGGFFPVLIHGPGPDLLSVFVAHRLSDGENRIALTRLVTVTLRVLACLGAIGTVALATVAGPIARSERHLAVGMAFALIVLGAPVFGADVRDTAFLLQLATLMGFIAAAKGARWALAALAAGIIGSSVPVAFFYSYDRAFLMVAVVVIVTPLIISLGKTVLMYWVLGVAAGAAAGLSVLAAVVGATARQAVLEDLGYWARYGVYIATIPFLDSQSPYRPITIGKQFLAAAGIVLIQCVAVVFFWRERRRVGTWRRALAEAMPVAVLFIVGLVSLRGYVERHHVGYDLPLLSTMLAIVIGACVVAQAVGSGVRRDTLERWAGQRPLRTVFFAITIGVVISVAAPLLNPLSALRTLLWYGRSVHTRDTGVIGSDYRQAAAELGDEVRASGCFFTLTSEGVWYYFFSTPSCSRFHHLVYARSRAAQSELIAALERGRPSLILFSNRFWSNNIDKLSVFNSNAPVVRHVMASYRPYRLVGSHWFWQRTESPYRFDDGPAGSLDPVPSQVSKRRDVLVTGSLTTVPSDRRR